LRRAATPGRGHRSASFASHTLGNWGHKRRPPRDARVRGAEAEQIRAAGLEIACELDGFSQRLLVATVLFKYAETHGQRQVFRSDFANGSQGFEEKTTALIEAVTVGIGALVECSEL
jgi:hypothetical protein